jgi:hypothetical protein
MADRITGGIACGDGIVSHVANWEGHGGTRDLAEARLLWAFNQGHECTGSHPIAPGIRANI